MSYLLTDPDVVLVAAETVADTEAVEGAVRDGTAGDVVGVEATGDAVAEMLASRDDVGCVVVTAGEAVAPALEAAREADAGGRLPVVAYVEPAEDVAAYAAGREGCRYLPRTVEASTLRAVVDDALSTYAARRPRAAESSLFTTLLDEGDINVYAKDSRGRHLYRADIDAQLTPEDAEGKTDLDLASDRYEAEARRTYRDDLDVVETGEPIYEQVERYDVDDEFYVETTKVPWRDGDGDVHGLIGLTRDVTEREQLRRELDREHRRVERFVRYVSHDLRTPLQVAIGAVDRAREGDDAAFDSLERAHDRIQEIVDDLGTLATGDRLAPGTAPVESDTGIPSTDLVPLLRNVWASLKTDDATLDLCLPDATGVVAPRAVLRPVFENLFKNAVEHAGPDVTVRVGTLGDRGLFVADDGPGIPEDRRDRVTAEGFSTGELSTGTGLSIVREVVDRQGWDLRLTESEAGGARIEIRGCHVVTAPSMDGRPAEPLSLSTSTDVGSPSLSGRSERGEAGRWRVVAGGFNVWNRTNEFHFVSASADAPVRIQARLAGFDAVSDYSKAGVMVREHLEEDAPQAFVGASGGHGTELLWRYDPDGSTTSFQFEESDGPDWYRVDFADGRATCAVSVDGESWQPVGQFALALTDPVQVGLLACSRSNEDRTEARFADVTACTLDLDE